MIAFIFADLIVLPILDIYHRYYGWTMAGFLLATFYATMVTLAFHDMVAPGVVEIYLVGADGSRPTQLTHMNEPPGPGSRLCHVVPNGKKIAFNSARNPDIYVINVDGSGLRRLTDDPASDARPDWSPDGTKIASPATGMRPPATRETSTS